MSFRFRLCNKKGLLDTSMIVQWHVFSYFFFIRDVKLDIEWSAFKFKAKPIRTFVINEETFWEDENIFAGKCQSHDVWFRICVIFLWKYFSRTENKKTKSGNGLCKAFSYLFIIIAHDFCYCFQDWSCLQFHVMLTNIWRVQEASAPYQIIEALLSIKSI